MSSVMRTLKNKERGHVLQTQQRKGRGDGLGSLVSKNIALAPNCLWLGWHISFEIDLLWH